MKMIAVAGMKGDIYHINAHNITELSEQGNGETSLVFIDGPSTVNGVEIFLRCDELARIAAGDPTTVGITERVKTLLADSEEQPQED
tara:strand:+ start:2250 stop:2510 length:261 start_codon:yes stop_codon:yes gene_type:complete